MSFPHFYHGDEFYTEQIDGMKPDKDKHQFFMTFEPKTAIPLEVAARFQINILSEPIPNIPMYRDVPKKILPILWFEQHVKMSESIADEIKLVLKLPTLGQISFLITAFVGLLMCLISCGLIMRKVCYKKSKRKVKDYDHNGNNALIMQNVISDNNNPEIKKLLYKEALTTVK
jgi:hypothetical protein